jgi:hypothetical protein
MDNVCYLALETGFGDSQDNGWIVVIEDRDFAAFRQRTQWP